MDHGLLVSYNNLFFIGECREDCQRFLQTLQMKLCAAKDQIELLEEQLRVAEEEAGEEDVIEAVDDEEEGDEEEEVDDQDLDREKQFILQEPYIDTGPVRRQQGNR